ncbi:MAG: GNAT family N-acetyltransferase [Legionellaceae bacterium]|nr:GNAT family N-acetyltransferase [Legionellaceae bacterium]
MNVNAALRRLIWDSDFFQRPIYDWCAEDGERLDMALLPPDSLVQAKVAAGDFSRLLALQEQGFILVESEWLFARSLLATDYGRMAANAAGWTEGTDCNPIPPSAAEAAAVLAIAAEVFTHSRFRAPWFTAEETSRLYRQWALNALDQSFDEVCLVEKRGGQVSGLVSGRMLDRELAVIGLLGSASGTRGQGVGACLLRAIEVWALQQGAKSIQVATQGSNLSATRFYVRQGYVPQKLSYWLYKS